jgi:hypothetical protein
MARILPQITLAIALFLVGYPTSAQQPPATRSQAPSATPFVGNWTGIVAFNNANFPVQITIAPFGNTFAAKVIAYRDGAWQPSPLVELQFRGNVFGMSFPSGNRYEGMRAEGDTLRGFFFWRQVGQTAAVQFTRQP